ncbi:MAG: insulinase family protein [candidate division Zixibacteria bacterium]|nr:insulinase family protein [candidate division Zixibacteria bacterium]
MTQKYLLMIVIFAIAASNLTARTVQITLDNGLVVVLKENRATPLVSGMICVRAGSKFEDESNNGFTHFLEHLLFNGTKTKSRLEFNEGFKNHGGYINAFTQKDLTAYLFVIPTEFTEYALEAQADQLFNSILPENEFPKERKIVIEEIRKDYDNPDYQAEMFFDSLIYQGTPYARPVLGPIDVIASIPREQVLAYYQEHYVPNNMIGLFIGDFEIESFAKLVNKYYGQIPAGQLPPPQKFTVNPPYDNKIHIKEYPAKISYVHITFPAPHYKDPDYYAIDMLAQLLDAGESSPLYKALNSPSNPLVNEMSVYLETQSDFSLLHFRATTENPKNIERIVTLVKRVIGEAANFDYNPKQLKRVVTRIKTDDIYMEEKLHYYGFQVASKLVDCGYAFVQGYADHLSQVKPIHIKTAAAKYYSDGKYLAMAMVPGPEKGK